MWMVYDRSTAEMIPNYNFCMGVRRVVSLSMLFGKRKDIASPPLGNKLRIDETGC
jgi:hypothetical protein